MEKAAAGKECTGVVTGLRVAKQSPPGLGLPLASDFSHADKAHADSGRQDWAERLGSMCH